MTRRDLDWLRENIPAIRTHEMDVRVAVDDHMRELLDTLYEEDDWQEYANWFVHNLADVYAHCWGVLHKGEELYTVDLMKPICELLSSNESVMTPWFAAMVEMDRRPDWFMPVEDLPPVCRPADTSAAVSAEDLLRQLFQSYIDAFEALFMAADRVGAIRGIHASVHAAAQMVCLIVGVQMKALEPGNEPEEA